MPAEDFAWFVLAAIAIATVSFGCGMIYRGSREA